MTTKTTSPLTDATCEVEIELDWVDLMHQIGIGHGITRDEPTGDKIAYIDQEFDFECAGFAGVSVDDVREQANECRRDIVKRVIGERVDGSVLELTTKVRSVSVAGDVAKFSIQVDAVIGE